MRREFSGALLALGLILFPVAPALADGEPEPEVTPEPDPEPEAVPPPERPVAEVPERPSVALMDISAGPGVKKAAAEAATQWVEGWLVHFDAYQVTSAAQLRAMLGFEAQKQLLGCVDAECSTDFEDLLKTDRLLAGTLTRVGSSARLNLALIDTTTSRRLAGGTRMVVIETTIEPLLQETAGLVHELLAKDPSVKNLTPPPVNKPEPPPTVTVTAYPTLSDLRKDPRNGFSLMLAGGFQAGAPILQGALHGQGGAVGMGLELGWLDPKGPANGILLRPELRIMPVKWKFLAPFVGFAGGIVFFNDATAPNPGLYVEGGVVDQVCYPLSGEPVSGQLPCDKKLYRALLGPRLGVQFAFGHLQAILLASYEFEVRVAEAYVDATTEPAIESEADLAKGFGFQLMLGLRL